MNMRILALMFVAGGALALGAVAVAWGIGWLTFKKSLKVAVFIVLFCAVNFPLTHYLSLKTIAVDYQYGSYEGSQRWGYKLQYDRWRNESELTLWEGWGGLFMAMDTHMSLTYKYPTYFSPPTVKERRWLAKGTAIYLHLGINLDNSLPSESQVRFIYDFQRGQAFATRYASRSLVDRKIVEPDEVNGGLGPMALSDEDFDKVLAEIEKSSS